LIQKTLSLPKVNPASDLDHDDVRFLAVTTKKASSS